MIEREDFWRRTEPLEWQHVIVFAPGLELLFNLSLTPRAARAIVMARAERWSGFVESTTTAIECSADGTCVRVCAHRWELRDGRYHIAIDSPDHDVLGSLVLTPRGAPLSARQQRLGRGRLHWTLYSRLDVSGRLDLGWGPIDLTGAVAYHDHNWGDVTWGDDFVWEWGIGIPEDPRSTWALVYSHLADRGRGDVQLRQMFLWEGGLNVLAVGAPELRALTRGAWTAAPGLRLPGALALAHPRSDADLPAALTLEAPTVSAVFELDSHAQLLVPAEHDPLGAVTINECTGTIRVLGELGGRTVDWRGRGVFEFVRH